MYTNLQEKKKEWIIRLLDESLSECPLVEKSRMKAVDGLALDVDVGKTCYLLTQMVEFAAARQNRFILRRVCREGKSVLQPLLSPPAG